MICLGVVEVEVAGWLLLTSGPALELVLNVIKIPDKGLICPLDALQWAAANSKRNHFTRSILSYVAAPYISDLHITGEFLSCLGLAQAGFQKHFK